MKKLSRLLLVLGLALCISLTAYAEDAPAAQPTAKEPRTLTARTGTETSLWNAYAFLAQHGTAYRFAPCAVQTPADAAGTAPAEDAVAVLRLYTTYVEKDTPVNIDGHVFLAVTNNTDAALAKADKWSAWHNCAAFGAAVWNTVCTDKVDPGTPPTPASLAASVRSCTGKWNADPAVPFDYVVYYGYPAVPSKEFA